MLPFIFETEEQFPQMKDKTRGVQNKKQASNVVSSSTTEGYKPKAIPYALPPKKPQKGFT